MADNTFSIDTGNAVMQQPGPEAQPVQAVAQPANVPSGIAPQAPADNAFNSATNEALLKLGSDILAPKIKEAQQQQFMEGVQRSMTGEAVKDIVADQPWYTQVFGPSSAVAGARAYSTAQQVAVFGAEMEKQMPLLAQKGPEALTGAVQGLIKKIQTGDQATDAAIMSQVVDQMAPLYKRHAKEHYLYTQNRANDEQVDAWSKLGDAYQERATAAQDPRKPVSAEDLKADKDRFIGNLGTFADQTEESYNKNMTRFLAASAQSGNMHVIKMFKDEGFFQKLPPEDRAKLEPVFRAGGARALSKVTDQFAVDMAMMEHDYTQNPANIPKRAAGINAKASALTGVPVEDAQLLPGHTTVSAIGRTLTHQQTLALQQQAEAQKTAWATTGIKNGNIDVLVSTGATDEAHVERVLAQGFDLSNPQQAATIANSIGGHKTTVISAALNRAISSDDASDGGMNALQTYRLMNDQARGVSLAGANSPAQRFLSSLDANMRSGMPIAVAWKAAKVVAPAADNAIPEKDKKVVDVAIRDVASDANTKWWGRQTIDDASLRMVTALTNTTYKSINNGGVVPPEQAAKQAYYSLQHSGSIEQVGRHILLTDAKNPGVDTKTYFTTGEKNIGTEPAGEAFDSVFKEKAKAQGLDVDLVQFMFRAPDTNGVPQYMAAVSDKDGGSHMVHWNGAEIKEHATKPAKPFSLPTLPNRSAAPAATPPTVLGTTPLDEASQTLTR